MENDSGETVNLAVRQEHAGERDKHRQILEEWAIVTNDDFPYVNK